LYWKDLGVENHGWVVQTIIFALNQLDLTEGEPKIDASCFERPGTGVKADTLPSSDISQQNGHISGTGGHLDMQISLVDAEFMQVLKKMDCVFVR
jgi:hypothetical protein